MATKNPKEEKTLVLIKPDGVKRGLIGEVVARIEKRGLKVIAISMVKPSRKQIDEHYPKDLKWVKRLGEKSLATYAKYGWDPKKEMGTDDPMKIGKSVRNWILDFMTSGPVVKIVVEGIHAVDMVRKLVGNSIPALAEMGTIRGDFSVDSAALANKGKRAVHNLIHASETPEEARHELKYWFKAGEIFEYKRAEEDIMF
ncbi:nucleoside-diphosphate kinase [Candidatus Azambacteria bacterium RIFCSPHIGHO2_01_FULL_44_55]|uniref:nucleoside-diphosphate kinase n=1 Tax=Candidatus Azambacteria bacterium RIFCSPLOWO2_02_FULL_44_14 TaxID=1797306 RepID=A0A1F5CBF1_9BACT|nr:MAG: nucleoside-diphosphate kinase [Candidatus Azambacteria bacterium RIFCSPLOWO2_01_FULL_44_84]OGD32724.1 MAG: nucleoside-diphosphate kinase [Candidatus Azambacteria bacterium RIFCSPHIGHO2_02_FULL_45_18]OGD40177.1 MAG: nucleoside-diphosphate kinase [Candidatus Azambacteria bacterium RIFCSPLOWO2_02_FULL_44_14]OGD41709.1 MAG: nucleoside-diphosphate kinase [Candidatus Azambacteria bacterium RIFCSPHIGHO2_01_FULL_44_55]OGD50072.1 MAG: nucleoside-diphosphate kinase [Candidatus Azambacteria bacter